MAGIAQASTLVSGLAHADRAKLPAVALFSSADKREVDPLSWRPAAAAGVAISCRRAGRASIMATKAVQTESPPPLTEDVELKQGIAKFYDESSSLWEDMWGEHMHHGYYEKKGGGGGKVDHQQAQRDMIENTLKWAGIPDDPSSRPQSVVDVGCGIGGSARHLSRKYGASVVGITLSPLQAARGNQLCSQQGLADKVRLQVADAMQQPFADGSFDLVWSMESGEHMPDKRKFVNELTRVVAPGGRIIVVTWCHRDLAEGEQLKAEEKALLKQICDAYYLPDWCSAADYVRLAKEAGLVDVRTTDWSDHISDFWPAVISSALTWRGFGGLLKAGWTTFKGAIAMIYMVQGYNRGLVKFALITGRKP